MKSLKHFFWLIMLTVLTVGSAMSAPKSKHYVLRDGLTFTAKFVPNLGVRFVFPFVLDELDSLIPFTMDITNPVFKEVRHKGRNSFVVSLPPQITPGPFIGDMPITVGGYHVTVRLISSSDLRQHYSDIYFDLPKEKKTSLIEAMVKKRIKDIEASFTEKEKALDKKAHEIAFNNIARMALSKPKIKRIRERSKTLLEGGVKAVLYLHEVRQYGSFYLLVYEVSNKSRKESIDISSVNLYHIKKGSSNRHSLIINNELAQTIEPKQSVTGVAVTESNKIFADGHIVLALGTGKGNIEIAW